MACNPSIQGAMRGLFRCRRGAAARARGRRTRAPGLLLAVVLLLQPFGLAAWAADGAAGSGAPAGRGLFADSDVPIEITADSMELKRKTSTIIYRGNVVVVRDDVRVTSDLLLARYDVKGGGLKRVTAEGAVRVRDRGREMTGDKAVFDSEQDTVVVSGNTTIRDGDNSISGDRITIYMKEDRILVENSAGRVRAVVFPGKLNR